MHKMRWRPLFRMDHLILTHLDRMYWLVSHVNEWEALENLPQVDMVLLEEQSLNYLCMPDITEKNNSATESTFTPRGRRTPISWRHTVNGFVSHKQVARVTGVVYSHPRDKEDPISTCMLTMLEPKRWLAPWRENSPHKYQQEKKKYILKNIKYTTFDSRQSETFKPKIMKL